MYFKPIRLSVNGVVGKCPVTNGKGTVFAWGAEHTERNVMQAAYRISVQNVHGAVVWDSTWQNSEEQSAVYGGAPLSSGSLYRWELTLRDDRGNISEPAYGTFVCALCEEWVAPWITKKDVKTCEIPYFRKEFFVKEDVAEATLMLCGLGIHTVTLNGKSLDDGVLQPLHCNYAKICYYVTLPVDPCLLEAGANCIGVKVGDGWREIDGNNNVGRTFERKHRYIEFFGPMQLTAHLIIKYRNGRTEQLMTDESWQVGFGGSVKSNLFNGEVYDENAEVPNWNRVGFDPAANNFENAVYATGKVGSLEAQLLPPIKEQKTYAPIAKIIHSANKVVYDFGTNIAGYVKITLPPDMPAGCKLRLCHTERLQTDGNVSLISNRNAEVTDTYICGNKTETRTWKPSFVYHGFRYVSIEDNMGCACKVGIEAISIYTDVEKNTYFHCGSELLNGIERICKQTEVDNIHGIATDCPQRDERYGWLNDATVRYEQMPYYLDMPVFFEKIVKDIVNEQEQDGSITCTAPFVSGSRPADPVCSSFLVAAKMAYLHGKNKGAIEKYYNNFKAWNECLAGYAKDGIVELSYYGDWASAADCCGVDTDWSTAGRLPKTENINTEDTLSCVTPGILMSTGYHYYNYKLLAEFADILGDSEEAQINREKADFVAQKFLEKWYDADSGTVATGSQGCQAFALWLGILPKEGRVLAAQRMHEAVEEVGWRITTGNLCTKYLMEMLTKYGYVEDAYRIMTREAYPSFGMMLQNDATTVWERFEYKDDPSMNSHNHPMYASVAQWFYKYLGGLAPTAAGWKTFCIKPYCPKDLKHTRVQVDTPYGVINVKWEEKDGSIHLMVNIPFGTRATVALPSGDVEVGSGFHTFSWSRN